MFKPTAAFSGFSVDNSETARKFYGETLGLTVTGEGYGSRLHLPGGAEVFFYPKGAGHTPATYTILNLVVDDVDAAVDELTSRGITFDANDYTDDKGIQHGIASGMGPDQAWFKDPAGNIISVLKEAPATS